MSSKSLTHVVDAILGFWFGEPDSQDFGKPRQAWFTKNSTFDAVIRERFSKVVEVAATGQLDMMADSPEGALALIIVLDQFPRNMFRDDARAFAHDAHARRIANEALEKGFDRELIPVMRKFMYMPFEHSEDIADQERAVALFKQLGEDDLEWAEKHRKIIERFGRFPHRNAVLGRISTPEEHHFLEQPGSSF